MMTADPEVELSNKPSSRLVSSEKERAGEDISGFLELFTLGSPRIFGTTCTILVLSAGVKEQKIGVRFEGSRF